ncbi:hypothetical protein N7532_001516 [Penicillium argentinense]|uniref:Uncharacterized protein n=1 Tax=Penicillium argentinense TaxID=1131581 RepID=A0A9W9G2M4_9EURO|nr:uncharacterized protein N7532_001516 [Penicillium argentinense]KAJ5110981.1 hypothetical protein N7532_001516 [Penicillium argentinense]
MMEMPLRELNNALLLEPQESDLLFKFWNEVVGVDTIFAGPHQMAAWAHETLLFSSHSSYWASQRTDIPKRRSLEMDTSIQRHNNARIAPGIVIVMILVHEAPITAPLRLTFDSSNVSFKL